MKAIRTSFFNLTLVFLLVNMLCCSAPAASLKFFDPQDPTQSAFWEYDKKEHFVVSATLSSLAYVLLRKKDFGRWEALVTSVALSILVGNAKEIKDQQVDPNDIKADAIGASFGGGVCFMVELVYF